MGSKRNSVPYAGARADMAARNEITKILSRFGCESVGFMDDFQNSAVILAFRHRGRQVQLRASAKGWAKMFLDANPWNGRRRIRQHDYEQEALQQGMVAVNSILRDWVKGQITAVETGILSFEAVFLPHMLTHDGRSLIDSIQANNLLPPPQS